VRRQRTRTVRIRVVVYATRVPQHALEFAQFRVLHNDEQGICSGNETNKFRQFINHIVGVSNEYSCYYLLVQLNIIRVPRRNILVKMSRAIYKMPKPKYPLKNSIPRQNIQSKY